MVWTRARFCWRRCELAVHLLELERAGERVLPVALPREREPPLRVLVLVADLLELLLGDHAAVEELAAALVLAAEARDVVLELGELLAEVQLVLVEREAGVADVVDLLGELGLVAERLQRELVVREPEQRLPGGDDGALLDELLLDLPADDGVEVDRAEREDVARDGDVLLKRPALDGRDREPVGFDVEPPPAALSEEGPRDEPDEEDDADDERDPLRRPRLLLDAPVHAFAAAGARERAGRLREDAVLRRRRGGLLFDHEAWEGEEQRVRWDECNGYASRRDRAKSMRRRYFAHRSVRLRTPTVRQRTARPAPAPEATRPRPSDPCPSATSSSSTTTKTSSRPSASSSAGATSRSTTATSPDALPALLREGRFDAILLDMNFQRDASSGKEGLHWLDRILTYDPAATVVMITAYGDVDLAVRAMKRGALDFVTKPWQNEKLVATISAAMRLRRTREEADRLRAQRDALGEDLDGKLGEIVGQSPAMQRVFETVRKVAPTDANVLVLGENGTGKELVARALHRLSARADEVFVAVDLGSLSESLFESELFGYVKGAFTGADEDRAGRFEVASGGTLFLDEIGNIPPVQQQKLLTVLQNREVCRVGSTTARPIDIRLVSATNRPIYESVQDRTFRQDLLYRINTVEIRLPPLREREGDLRLLAEHFVGIYARKYAKTVTGLSEAAIEKMETLHVARQHPRVAAHRRARRDPLGRVHAPALGPPVLRPVGRPTRRRARRGDAGAGDVRPRTGGARGDPKGALEARRQHQPRGRGARAHAEVALPPYREIRPVNPRILSLRGANAVSDAAISRGVAERSVRSPPVCRYGEIAASACGLLATTAVG